MDGHQNHQDIPSPDPLALSNSFSKSDTSSKTFSQNEIDAIKSALCEYALAHGMNEKSLMNLVSNDKGHCFGELWEFIQVRVPMRTVQSIKGFCHRRFNPYNYRGRWTRAEEKQLIELVQAYGCKWQKLSKIIERTPTNIRDKWRSLGEGNFNQRTSQRIWSGDDILRLIRLVESTHKFAILNTSDDEVILGEFTRLKERLPFIPMGQYNKNLNSLCRRIICNHLNHQAVEALNQMRIKWNLISKLMETKSKDDCRNYWNAQILKELSGRSLLQKKKVLQLYSEFQRQNALTERDIDWQSITTPRADILWNQIKNAAGVPTENLQVVFEAFMELSSKKSCRKYQKYQTLSTNNELLHHFRQFAS
jgi:hypothetical protein